MRIHFREDLENQDNVSQVFLQQTSLQVKIQVQHQPEDKSQAVLHKCIGLFLEEALLLQKVDD